jgi:TPR repeat protein
MIRVLAFLSFLLLAVPAAGEDLSDGDAALDRGDFAAALEIFGRLAAGGDTDAMVRLGQIYGDGEGVPRDDVLAAQHYMRAAKRGNAAGQVGLGYAYDYGLGVGRDPAEAEHWYERAAALGNITGMNNLAYTWSEEGRNLELALSLIEEAVALDPLSGAFQDTHGWVLYGLGRIEEALAPLCRAAVLDPSSPEIRLHLGDALWRTGRIEEARHHWRYARDLAAEPRRLDRSGEAYMGIQDEAGWNAMVEDRLAHGVPGAAAPDRPDLPPPPDCDPPIS